MPMPVLLSCAAPAWLKLPTLKFPRCPSCTWAAILHSRQFMACIPAISRVHRLLAAAAARKRLQADQAKPVSARASGRPAQTSKPGARRTWRRRRRRCKRVEVLGGRRRRSGARRKRSGYARWGPTSWSAMCLPPPSVTASFRVRL